jgi:hypothetical protein
MALVLADRVRETTTTTGTGTISLGGPVSGFQGFSTAIGNANTTYYTIVDAATGAWEVGLGTYTSSGSTLARTTILSSSNAGSAVNFAAGTKDVFVTQPAERALYLNGAGTGVDAGAAAFTANGVVYASSTSALATGSALTFDGANLAIGPQGSSGQLVVADAITTVVAANQDRRYRAAFKVGSLFYGGEIFGGLNSVGSAYFGVAVYDATSTSTVSTAFQSDNTQFYISGSEQMRLTSSGLEIKQSQLIGYSSYAGIGTNGLAVAGNVGVGTASPAAKLEVSVASSDATLNQEVIRVSTTGRSAAGGTANRAALISFSDASNTTLTGAVGGFRKNSNVDFAGGLKFFYNSAAASSGVSTLTDGMTLDSAGNLGLGVPPSAWGSTWKALEGSFGQSWFASNTATNTGLVSNAYNDGTNWVFKTVNAAVLYDQGVGGGIHRWSVSTATPVIGNNVVFSQAMTLDASGNLVVGNTSAASYGTTRAYIEAATDVLVAKTTGGASFSPINAWNTATSGTIELATFFVGGGSTVGTLTSDATNVSVTATAGALILGANNTERARISSDGTFRVKGAGTAGSTDAFQVAGTAPADAARIDSSGNLLVGTATASIYGVNFRNRVVTAGTSYAQSLVANDSVQWIHSTNTSGDNVFTYFVTEAVGTDSIRGSITYNRAAGITAFNVSSDYRAKEVYGPVPDSGAVIDSVPVYMGKMKGATQERPMFIAHEVPAYAHTGEKDAVDAEGKPVYQQMDASALIPVMWAEIQDLRKRLAAAGI